MGLPNHFRTSWYHPTPQSFRGSKLLKALPTVKGILYHNCFKTNLLLVVWDPRYYGILHSPSPWHHFPLSLDWRVQDFSAISLSSTCWDFSIPLAVHLHSKVPPWAHEVQGQCMHACNTVQCYLVLEAGSWPREQMELCLFFFFFSLFGIQVVLGSQVSGGK